MQVHFFFVLALTSYDVYLRVGPPCLGCGALKCVLSRVSKPLRVGGRGHAILYVCVSVVGLDLFSLGLTLNTTIVQQTSRICIS